MRSAAHIPNFSLYGESASPAARTDLVHIENIPARSRKYLWRIRTHRHSILSQCLLMTAGTVSAILDDSRAARAAPAAIVVPAGTVHSFKFRADTQGYVLTVDLARLLSGAAPADRAPIESLYAAPRIIDLRESPSLGARLVPLFELLDSEYARPEAAHAPVCGWLASSVLSMLAQDVPSAGAEGAGALDAERLRDFRGLVEERYLDHWPVRRYAQRLGIAETSLNRLCRRGVGCTAFELIRRRLALEARRRLIYGTHAISGVAADLGFKDPAYFSRFFRRQTGASPHEFRARHHGGRTDDR
ncbi:MAG TPA: helix-turn-helix domain-containing protein [Steroidobacteraceae bacterium]|nr:helix-turn-helix domain-containing protein [Steroidobacteraceae bacterium]